MKQMLRKWWFDSRPFGNPHVMIYLALIRPLIFGGLTIRYYVANSSGDDFAIFPFVLCLLAFLYSLIILFYCVDKRAQFETYRFRLIQITTDTLFVLFLYGLTGQSRSDVFLLFLMPLIIITEYARPRSAFMLTALFIIGLGGALYGVYLRAEINEKPWITYVWVTRSLYILLFAPLYFLHRYSINVNDNLLQNLRKKVVRAVKDKSNDDISTNALLEDYETHIIGLAKARSVMFNETTSLLLQSILDSKYSSNQASEAILTAICKMLDCQAATLREFSSNKLILISVSGRLSPYKSSMNSIELENSQNELIRVFNSKQVRQTAHINFDSDEIFYKQQIRKAGLRAQMSSYTEFRGFRGVLSVYRDISGEFNKNEVDTFRRLSEYVGFVVYASRQLENELHEGEMRTRRLKAIQDLSEAIVKHPNENALLNSYVEIIQRELNVESVSIHLVRGNRLKKQVSVGIYDEADIEFRFDQGFIGAGFKSPEAIKSDNADADLRVDKEVLTLVQKKSRFSRIITLAASPLRITKDSNKQALGILRVINKLNNANQLSGTFSLEDLRFLDVASLMLAVALENIRRYHIEKTLIDLSQAIAHAGMDDQESILKAGVFAAREIIHVDQSGIALFSADSLFGTVVEISSKEDNVNDSKDGQIGMLASIPKEGNTSWQRISSERKPIAYVDAENDPELLAVRSLLKSRNVKSMLLAPLIIDGEVGGTLGFDSISAQREFTEEEMDICQVVANMLADAITNHELFAKASLGVNDFERRRLNARLHDAKGWLHGGVLSEIDVMRKDPSRIDVEKLNEIWHRTHFIGEQFNYMMLDIRYPELAKQGLIVALENMSMREKVVIESLINHVPEGLSRQQIEACYCIAQEAINNSRKHNQIPGCSIFLSLDSNSPTHFKLNIRDDGCGFETRKILTRNTSFGVQHMRELAEKANLEIKIESRKGRGTTVLLSTKN